MKLSALSSFVLSSLVIMGSFPSTSQAQISSLRRLTPPAPLKVPQSLPPTIYNSSDAHSPLPVPPNHNFSKTKAKTIREYVFTSGSLPEPIPQAKTTRTKKVAVRARKNKAHRTAIKPIFSPTPVKNIIPNIKPNIAKNSISPAIVVTKTLYRVQARETNANSLLQVKNVEPLAFVRQTDGFIHAGTFSEKSLAEQRVQALATQGVNAEVIAVPNGENNLNNLANLRFTRQ